MIIIGILLNIVGLGVFCWALFALAIHALPFFVGMTVGIYSFQTGAGPFGAIVVGFIAAGFTLVLGQYAFSVARSPIVRLVIGLLFAVPAARAGYDVTLALAHLGIPSEWWRESFAMVGAIAVGSTAWARVSMHDRARSQTGRCARPCPAAEWGDDHGRVTLRVYRLSVGDQRGYPVVKHDRDIAVLSHASIEPGDLVGRLRSGGRWRVRWLLSARRQRGRLSARQVFFSFAGNAGLLVWADR